MLKLKVCLNIFRKNNSLSSQMYVFDSCILVAALRSRRGASFLVLSAIRQRVIAGVLSSALFLDYADVLKRDQNLQQFWTTSDEIDVVLGVLASVLKPVPIYFQWRPQLRDPNDEMVLECAINGQASAIVTFNERDFLPAAQQFGIEVIQPGVLVRSLNLRERFSQ